MTDAGRGQHGEAAPAATGPLRRLRTWRSARVDRAVAAERRRLARELHDGVVQELGWIRSAAVRKLDHDEIVVAADRALADARQLIDGDVRTWSGEEPLVVAVERRVRDVAAGHDVRLHLELDDSTSVATARRQDLVRLAGEAVSNAVRHGGPTAVWVQLEPGLLHVRDDGRGFEPDTAGTQGHGLTSMRERAEELGGRLTVTSTPGAGTTVEVVW
jgi:signal transduction histidine kinase